LATALGRHIALIGFMGAGKSTVGAEVARRLGRPFVDVDDEIEHAEGEIWELFQRQGESAFRELEAGFVRRSAALREPSVIALGGGAVETRRLLDELDVFTVHLDVDVETAWERVQGSRRPLARDEAEFRRRYERRAPLYRAAAGAVARDVDDVVLAAAGVRVELGALETIGGLVPGSADVELAADAHVLGIHGPTVQPSLGERLRRMHELPSGEAAKTLAASERLWRSVRLDRSGLLVALGGGSTLDAAGFVAATYLRGIDWMAVPTTLVAQVDASIGGKTAIDLAEGKNLVGAFHWPVLTLIDPAALRTLPERERRNGMAEAVKTGLLAGEPLWELPDAELVRRCAAYKSALCVRDPFDRGPRTALNLGHTFAHALEAASDYDLAHGDAVALGLLAALRLSGLDTAVVEEVLHPRPARADPDRAWAALTRDKKAARGSPRLVLLEAPGRPRVGVELPEAEVRRALAELIAE
jgi:shikimate kinase / 3-dehydroquinate synthase